MPNSYIDRVGSYMPEEWIVSNEKFIVDYVRGKKGRVYAFENSQNPFKEVELSAEWMESTVGIKQRYFSPIDMNISEINAKSVEGMINGDENYKNSIEGIINAGVTGPGNFMTFPAHAAMFQLHAKLHDIKWAFDVATPYKSFETANDIAQALNSHQPGVYIALFSNTREDIDKPSFNTRLFGKITSLEIYIDGKPNTGVHNYSYNLRPSDELENTSWENNKEYIEDDYEYVSNIIKDELEDSKINPESVKGIFVINQTQKNSPLVKTNSYVIKENLGLHDLRWCFDITAACAATQLAYAIGDGMMPLTKNANRMIVSVGESLEKITDIYHEGRDLSTKDYMDANNVLFGTASACFGLARSNDSRGFVHFDGVNNPFDKKYKWIIKNSDGHIFMPAGNKVYKHAITSLSSRIIDKINNLEWKNYNMEHHTHNANEGIFEGIGRRVKDAGIDGEFIKNIHKIANASAGSCAKMTSERYGELVKHKRKITSSALGAGIAETFAAIQF